MATARSCLLVLTLPVFLTSSLQAATPPAIRELRIQQVGDTTYYGGLSGQNVQAGGGEFRLDAASTGTLTFVGSTASSGNATRSAPASSACSYASSIRATLPSRSPTTRLS